MQTQLIKIDPAHPESDLIRLAAQKILDGRLVAFPTETVYGLGANALNGDAVSRIFAAKGRPPSDPLIVHIYSLDQLNQVAIQIPDLAYRLAEKFWSGPLTLVLPRNESITPAVSAGLHTVAVRMPSHPVALALLRSANVPIAAPSANLFSRPSPTTAQHVLEDLNNRVDIILDSGRVDIGVESTVLDLTSDVPTILRAGGLTLEALRQVVPNCVMRSTYLPQDESAVSPGMMMKHYSPKAKMLLFDGERESVLRSMVDEARRHHRAGVLVFDEDEGVFEGSGVATSRLGSESDLAQIANNLFSAMRDLDQKNVDVILVRGVKREGLGLAIWDRLVRAAEGRVISK
ncbi:MAG: threonylcarbamoyl-AMP synthase [Chloroflexi bacterium]|nr:threonylcarbamoyl-AMP synthase [Chloroflexota bacterium]